MGIKVENVQRVEHLLNIFSPVARILRVEYSLSVAHYTRLVA